MPVALRAAFLGLLAMSVFCAVHVHRLESEASELREDVVELSLIKYGIFNVDEWKRIAEGIITKRIDEFDLSAGDRKELRTKVNTLLTDLVQGLRERFNEANQQGMLGFMKREGAAFFGLFDQIEKDIPAFTDQILHFLDDPGNRKKVKSFLTDKVNEYADRTFAETDYTLHDAILVKHDADSREEAILLLNTRLDTLSEVQKPYVWGLYAAMTLGLLYLITVKPGDVWVLTCIIATAVLAMLLGLLLPMIEIDARIDLLHFQMLGEPIIFTDQVLFFKSKSILQVVQLMLAQGKADLMAVALLVFVFSVLFPVSKMAASLVFVHFDGSRRNRVISFLVFKTGKWSMADVMVVAIFMSYIGFSGIVSEQLSQLGDIARDADVLTTNHSSLRLGFFMFASFVLLSLGLAQRMEGLGIPVHIFSLSGKTDKS